MKFIKFRDLYINTLKNRLLLLLKKEAYTTGYFILSSGDHSNFLIDCKKVLLKPEGHFYTGMIFLKLINEVFPQCDTIAGVELGGCPIVSAVSTLSYSSHYSGGLLESNLLNGIYVRKQAKKHGSSNKIEGNLSTVKSVVLLEDVITTGKSTLNAIQSLKEANLNVIGVVSIVDRLEGGSEKIKNSGIECFSIFTVNDLKE